MSATASATARQAAAEYTFDLAAALVAWPQAPASIVMSLKLYTEQRLGPGTFLRAILENDLRETVTHCNPEHRPYLFAIVSVVFWFVPAVAWGSKTRVSDWLHRKERF